ncbi:TPA: hypothetical protein MYL17_004913 [Klebsiella pneumoniae]|uniref:hypothetical protein n=1 Tax=Klebsiella pneumoniae TaxID=573 RepID=UPI000E2C3A06|nr:hypothetical protein [Klebsiella pneumoniae]AYK02165.1 hypothetical protein D9K63_27725 [Klebsiella pneumoniae]TYW62017.1 hypothetical protein FCG65_019895 [Klebsiella pneumoniae]WJU41541.1 hypothetical protein QU747_26045 [Klebsiella pneumoniae]WLX55233.1 hypothetical protein RA207_26230 [Klebsiella pneumoniae]SWP98619.1 Uncharacterised protein [Klebsiella pneumoniae]
MRSEYITIHEFYKLLRESYISRFPQRFPINFDMTANYKTMLIGYFNNRFRDAKINNNNGRYELIGDIIDVYKKNNPPEGSLAYLISKLSDKEELSKFINNATKDLEDLDNWLSREGFVKEGVASEKLLKQKEIEILL